MPDLSTRLGLKKPVGGDPVTLLRQAIADNAAILDNAATYAQGTLAGRGAAGTSGRLYRATDVGTTYLDDGSSWRDVNPGTPPIGAQMPYSGSGDPPGGEWLVADGRLISATSYPAFAAIAGTGAPGGAHPYNGGVDPGGGMVRIPDKRGRVSVGADNMGTQGAANRIPNSNRARGQNGGVERLSHTHSVTSPDHLHTVGSLYTGDHAHGVSIYTGTLLGSATGANQSSPSGAFAATNHFHLVSGGTGGSGAVGIGGATGARDRNWASTSSAPSGDGSGLLSLMQPFEIDSYIVRVA